MGKADFLLLRCRNISIFLIHDALLMACKQPNRTFPV